MTKPEATASALTVSAGCRQGPRADHAADVDSSASSRLRRWAIALFAVNCLLRILLAMTFPLDWRESYYWEWSRFPSLGYLEHPPIVAWVIGLLGSVLPVRSVFALRCGALLFGTGSLLLIYHLALLLFEDRRIACRALLVALALPLLNIMGVLMLADAPLIFFHLLFLYLFAAALRRRKARYWCLAGLALGLALMSKLTAGLALLASALFLTVSRTHRSWLKSWQPYLALLIALLVVCPFLYWNWTHDWVTIRHHFWSRPMERFGLSVLKTAEVAFEQLANTWVFLLVPVIGVLFVRSRKLPQEHRPWFRMLKYQSAVVLAYFFAAGSISQTHPQWTVMAYPTAAIAAAALSVSRPAHFLTRRLGGLIALSIVSIIVVACLTIAAVRLVRRIGPRTLPAGWSGKLAKAQVKLFGWRELSAKVAAVAAESSGQDDAMVFTNDFQQAAMLSFYRTGDPVVNLAPVYKRRWKMTKVGDAQLFYMPWRSLAGKSGIFISGDDEGDLNMNLRSVFDGVEELSPLELRYNKELTIRHRVFRVTGLHPPGAGP